MAVGGYELRIFLLDPRILRVSAESPHEIIIAMGDDVKLGIAIDTGSQGP